jgi:hypothetical protein
VPDHNPKAIKKVFRATVEIANHFKLIGGKLLAGDSSKFRAQNSPIQALKSFLSNIKTQFRSELSKTI